MFLCYCYDSTELEAIHGSVAHRIPPPLSVIVTAGIIHLTLPYLPHTKVSISILIDSLLIWIISYLKSKVNFLSTI